MYKVAVFVSSLAWTGHTRRSKVIGDTPLRSDQVLEEPSSLEALSKYLLAVQPAPLGMRAVGRTRMQRSIPRVASLPKHKVSHPRTRVLDMVEEEKKEEEKPSDNLMQKVKDAGIAGIISYTFWEWAFWGISIPVCIYGYFAATGHFPDFSNQEDIAKLSAEAFAFVNLARFAIPLRVGLALGTTPWVKENIVDKFGWGKKKEDNDAPVAEEAKTTQA